MAGPITWRTVVGQSLADAARPMELAGRSMNGAFDKLQDVLKDRENIDAANWNTIKANNTQAFLDEVAKYRTPQELAAAQASGALDAVKAGFGNQIDSAVVRGAADSRLTSLYDQTTKANAFADQTTEREQRPLVQSILTDAYSRDPLRMAKAQNTLIANPQLAKSADMQKIISDTMRQAVTEGREDTRFKWDETAQQWKVAEEAHREKIRPLDIKAKEASIRSANNAADASAVNAEASRFRLTQDRAAAESATKVAQLKSELSDNIYADGTYRDAVAPELMEIMTKSGIGDDNKERNAIIARLSGMRELTLSRKNAQGVVEPVKIPLPLGAVKAAILSSHDQWVNAKDEGWANVVEKRLKDILQNGDLAQERAVGDYLRYSDLIGEQAKAPSSTKRR